ncbi:hypothetical protein VPNG_08373 [Cytospora leucostoma]|uniref:Cytochrome P450 n=1 Tax=Cytospora leucostoma TaxID=1230097 RepID=A0A423W9K2_9PEZI|nr:hypothetical protein VPNG_08373 [Cytospora leucostoma]
MATLPVFQLPGGQTHSLVLAALGIAVIGFVFHALRNPLAKVPGPWYTKFTGAILTIQTAKGNGAIYVHNLHEKYGPIVRIGPNEVDVMDLRGIKEIHSVKATYVKTPYYETFGPPGMLNLFNTQDVNFHRRHRRLLQGPFSEAQLKAFHPTVEHRVRLAVQRMGEEVETRRVADVFKWWMFMATDVIGELTFGESFRMLELGQKNEYIQALERVAATLGRNNAFPLAGKLAYYGVPIPGFGDDAKHTKNILRYSEESLARYRGLVQQNPDKPIPTLFTRLFKGEEEENLSFKELVDAAQGYIVAGSDTTAVGLTYLVWNVCRNPEIQKRLVEEVQQLPADYHDQDLVKLPYLSQVIKETLRRHAPAPASLPRLVPPGGATFAGNYLPGGAVVSTQAWSLHRNSEVFPDPEKFDPDRWAAPTKEMKDWFMPFGGGSRVCIGAHLAELEMRLATVLFFRTFPNAQVSTREGMSDDDMVQVPFFLAPPRGKRCLIELS